MLDSDENDTCSPDEDPLTVTSIGHFTREPTYNQDLLICGVCQRIFALSDILKFIRHKVKSCTNKESLGCNSNSTSDKLDGTGGNGHGDPNLFNAGDTGDDGCADDEPVVVSSASASSECDGPFNNSSGPAEVRKQTPSIINSSQRHKLRKTQQSNTNHHSSHQTLMQNCITSSSFNPAALMNQSISSSLFNSRSPGTFLYANNNKSDPTVDPSVYPSFNTTGNNHNTISAFSRFFVCAQAARVGKWKFILLFLTQLCGLISKKRERERESRLCEGCSWELELELQVAAQAGSLIQLKP